LLQSLAHDDATKTLVDYWCSLPRKTGELCPSRNDFRMMDISEISDRTFLDERHGDDNICVVQTGSTITKLLGVDLTGHNILEMLPPRLFAIERAYFQALASQPCAGYITRHSSQATGRKFIYRSTHLPLLSDAGNVGFWVGTGSILEENHYPADENASKFGHLELLDREYFDIGAGVPKPEMLSPAWTSRAPSS